MSDRHCWAVAEWGRDSPRRGWYPHCLSFARRQTTRAFGLDWTIQHLVQSTSVDFAACLSIEPDASLTRAEVRLLEYRGVFAQIGAYVALLGYDGQWWRPQEGKGRWRRRIVSSVEAHAELGFLDEFDLRATTAPQHARESMPPPTQPRVAGNAAHVAACWHFLELADSARPADCVLDCVGFSHHVWQRVGERKWGLLAAIDVCERRKRLFETMLHFCPFLGRKPSPEKAGKLSKTIVTGALKRATTRALRANGYRGRWHAGGPGGEFAAFLQSHRLTIARLDEERKHLDQLKLSELMETGSRRR